MSSMYAIYVGDDFLQSVEGEMAAVIASALASRDNPECLISMLEVETGDPVIDFLYRDETVLFDRHKDYSGT